MSNFVKSGRVQRRLIHIRSSLWFVPSLIILGAMALAIGLVELDKQYDDALRAWWPRVFANEPEGARSMLSAIATTMATVAGVVFSITIVALALASSQYTSRVLRTFMRDRANQIVLGIFIGVYLYCLLVLRTTSGGGGGFVPALAVLGAVGLAIFASGAFIFFIHHISSSIQASEIVAAITRETLGTIDILFPDEVSDEACKAMPPKIPTGPWHPVPALRMGYVQSVDQKALLEFARDHDTVVRMECGVGDFIGRGRTLLSLAVDRAPGADVVDDLNQMFAIDSYRTVDQDAAFGIRQLVDIALKALSPGINDTTTAVTCIEHLSVLLEHCARRGMAATYRFDDDVLRVIAQQTDFSCLVALAFSQILENADGNTEILLRLLVAIEQVACAARGRLRFAALRRMVNAIDEAARCSAKSSDAQQQIRDSLERVRLLIDKRDPVSQYH